MNVSLTCHCKLCQKYSNTNESYYTTKRQRSKTEYTAHSSTYAGSHSERLKIKTLQAESCEHACIQVNICRTTDQP